VARAAELASLGRDGRLTPEQLGAVTAALADDDERVRAAALGASVRGGPAVRAAGAWRDAMVDPAAAVRRRAAELAPLVVVDGTVALDPLLVGLGDDDVTVVEACAWALGELGARATSRRDAIGRLARTATDHRDPLAREAAVAALGALGDPDGLGAVLHATGDRAAVRRRAVLALAPFHGPDVDAAIARALTDKDWQVRQAAEDLQPGDDARDVGPAQRSTGST
jgi:HEAT repeat protein